MRVLFYIAAVQAALFASEVMAVPLHLKNPLSNPLQQATCEFSELLAVEEKKDVSATDTAKAKADAAPATTCSLVTNVTARNDSRGAVANDSAEHVYAAADANATRDA